MSSESADVTASLLRAGLAGRFRIPAGKTRSLALLILGGAEGGFETADELAEDFLTEGFATLALAYFGVSPLPTMLGEIPLEYFHTAIDWLCENFTAGNRSVGLVGHSKGAEAALLIGASAPRVGAVVAYAPSHVAWQALNWKPPPQSSWTYQGTPVPFVRYVRADHQMPQEGWRELYAASLEANPDAVRTAEIPVERTHGGILLVSGGEDCVWPSSEMGRSIVQRLRAKRFSHAYEHLDYADAGHAIAGLKDVPPVVKGPWGEFLLGGTEAANASARIDAWRNVLRFLKESRS